MIMKGLCNGTPVYGRAGIELGTVRSVGQRLTTELPGLRDTTEWSEIVSDVILSPSWKPQPLKKHLIIPINNWPLKRQIRLQQTTFINILCLFFKENKTWCFKWILCRAEDSHEKNKPYFLRKIKVKNKKNKSKKLKCRLLQFLFGASRVKGLVSYTVIVTAFSETLISRSTLL